MRPRELVLGGFRSYASETRFCWDDRSLVGIVGPIGSGKSSILDAISFALYNQTPRSGTQTKSLINQRRDAAQVSLTFDVDATTYKAVRSLRRNGASAHALYRVEDGSDVELADRANDVLAMVETLLGLDFSAFQRSVLLAQNQFAGFLESTGTERNTVLKGVFGFDRLDAMRSVAKERLDRLGNRLAVLADRRATGESDRTELVRSRAELEAAEERASALEGLRVPFEETKETIGEAERRHREAQQALERIDAMAGRIPDREQAEAMLAAAGDTGARVAAAEAALREASEARAAAAAGLDEVLRGVGGRDGLTRAGDLVAAWRSAVERVDEGAAATSKAERRLAELTTQVESLEHRRVAAEAAAAEAERLEVAALEEVEATNRSVEAARQTHRAHALRDELVLGEPCPVCEQSVGVLPTTDTPPSIEVAEQAAAAARTRRADLSAAAREASERLTRLGAEAEGMAQTVAAAEADLSAARETEQRLAQALETAAVEVNEVLGDGDPDEVLADARARSSDAEQALAAAVAVEAEMRQALEEARGAARGADAALASLRAELSSLSGVLGVDITIRDDRESLANALQHLRAEWIQRRAAADAAVPAAADAVAAGRAALAELLDAAGLGTGDDVAEVVAAAVAERSAKEAEVSLLEKRIADLERLAADEAELVTGSERLARIHSDLAPAKFLGFVLDERRRVLGDLASEHFEILSAGRYRFDDSGEFHVVDLTAADSIRSPASLSGGETFLASLALALALAEIVSREGGRLDAFFLDEGFGSLDPEHLDLAMSGIERLVTTGPERLVVVVSHVPAMNERIEDLIVLDREPMTGDTRVMSGGGCG